MRILYCRCYRDVLLTNEAQQSGTAGCLKLGIELHIRYLESSPSWDTLLVSPCHAVEREYLRIDGRHIPPHLVNMAALHLGGIALGKNMHYITSP